LATLCAHEKTTVPSFVEKCINAVERRGNTLFISQWNNYKVYLPVCVIKQLTRWYELDLEDGQWEDVHVITGALKLFFRELSEPLFPYSHFNKFISAISEHSLTISLILSSLPAPNHDTMKLLFGHLHRFVTLYFSDNRMTVQNVAIVFGPTLLRPEMESGNIAMHMVFQNQIVEFVLNEYNYLFQ
uniref:Rho GTPase activating protein 27 n=1 Tax=Neolamprologus brichardi TaxID=32507 RepID=A0A3Q4GLE3_NEOBR